MAEAFSRKSRQVKRGKILLSGCWIENISAAPSQEQNKRDRRHADFHYRTKPELAVCPNKWAIRPLSCPDDAQWRVHNVTRMEPDRLSAAGGIFRHFRPISTSWKYMRDRAIPFDPARHVDPARHECDTALVAALDRTGLSEPIRAQPPSLFDIGEGLGK